MIFTIATRARAGSTPPARAEHVAFGSVLGTDKRMFKSRSGDTVRLVDVIDEAIDRAEVVAREKAKDSKDLDEATLDEIARDRRASARSSTPISRAIA